MAKSMSDKQYDWRVNMENDVRGLGEEMVGMKTNIGNQSKAIDNLTVTIDRYMDQDRKDHKTPWGVLISAVALFVVIFSSIIAAFSTGYIRDISNLQAAQFRLEETHITRKEVALLTQFAMDKETEMRRRLGLLENP